MKNRVKELCCMLFILIMGGLIFVLGDSYSSAVAELSGDVGPAYFPKLIGISLIALGLIHGASQWIGSMSARKTSESVQAKTDPKQDAPKTEGMDPKGGIYSILLILAYCAVLDFLGFVITSTVYVFLQILVLSYGREKKTVRPAIIVALLFPISVYLIWYYGFKVPLPAGLLPLHLWI